MSAFAFVMHVSMQANAQKGDQDYQRASRLIRHALTALGGALIAAGYVTSEEWATIAGAIAVLIGVVWSVIAKRITGSRTINPHHDVEGLS